MSGHSRWSTIKRKKGAADAKKGKIFTKLIREITVAAKIGGGSPDANARLRSAILAARAQNMPSDNIDRAIKKGTGELEGVNYEELTYEGYGPAGVAILADVLTDNKLRTVSEIRHIFSRHGGNLGENGCVAWNFENKGLILIAKTEIDEDTITELAIEAGAEDVRDTDLFFEVVADPKDLEGIRESLEKRPLNIESASLTKIPKTTLQLDLKQAEQFLKLVESLEDNDDVQNVYSNADIPQEVLDQLGQ